VSAPPSPTLSTSPNQQDIDGAQPSCSEVDDLPSVAASLLGEETLPKQMARRQDMDPTGSKDLPGTTLDVSSDNVLQSSSTSAESSKTVESKRDKRRARRQAKNEAVPNNDEHLKCNVCSQGFPSKTKLFTHIMDSRHAMAVAEDSYSENQKEKGKKKRR